MKTRKISIISYTFATLDGLCFVSDFAILTK